MAGVDCGGDSADDTGATEGGSYGIDGGIDEEADATTQTFDGKLIVSVSLVGIDGEELKASDMMKAAVIAGVADALTVFVEKVSIVAIESVVSGAVDVTLQVVLEGTSKEKLEAKSASVSNIGGAQIGTNIKKAGKQLGILDFSPGVNSITSVIDDSDASNNNNNNDVEGADNTFFLVGLVLSCLVVFVLCMAFRRSGSSSRSSSSTALATTAGRNDATGQWLSDEPITKPNVSIL
jgi:hypothetical protein